MTIYFFESKQDHLQCFSALSLFYNDQNNSYSDLFQIYHDIYQCLYILVAVYSICGKKLQQILYLVSQMLQNSNEPSINIPMLTHLTWECPQKAHLGFCSIYDTKNKIRYNFFHKYCILQPKYINIDKYHSISEMSPRWSAIEGKIYMESYITQYCNF